MITPVDGLEAFGPAAASAALVAAYLVVGEPVTGTVLHRRFEALERVAAGARTWLYSRILLLEWGLTALVVGIVTVAPGVTWAQVGVTWPSRSWVAAALAVATLAGLVAGTYALRGAVAGGATGEEADAPGPRSVIAMVPRTRGERIAFAAVSVTAGICEEVLFRGFLLAVLTALFPWGPDWALVVAGAVLFGLAHFYQGISGVLGTSVLGGVLGATYALTGSLLIPVLLHAAIDLRVLMVRIPTRPEESA